MRPIRFIVSLATWATLLMINPVVPDPRAAAGQLREPRGNRTLVVAIEVDRDGARLIGYTVKKRPFVPPREIGTVKSGVERDTVPIEIALIGPGGARYTQRLSVGGLCLAHGPETAAEIEGDTIRLHRESVLVEEPELAGFDRIDVTYDPGSGTALSRKWLGSATLDAAHYTGAGGNVRYDELAIAGKASTAPSPPPSPLTPGTVHFPEEYGDPDIVTVYGDAAESAKRINIVIVPDGYTFSEKATMQAHAQALVDAFRARTPYLEHDRFINYVLVYAYSTKDGTDQCDCAIVRDTAMSTRFAISTPICGDSDNRCLYYGGGCDSDSSAHIATTELRAPAHDVSVVMVNTARYGGCGGERAVYGAGNSNGTEIAIHEMGHTLAGLVDEYGGNPNCGAGGGFNASMDPVYGNWPEWIPELGPPSEGALYYDRCVYRPASNCEMRTLGTAFCPVCREQLALTYFGNPRVSSTAPIESATPESPVLTDQVSSHTFAIATRFAAAPGVVNEITWQLQGPGYPTATTVATGTNEYTQVFPQQGTYTLTSRAVADTNFIKPGRYGANVDTASWTVTVCDAAGVSSASNNGPICAGATLQLGSARIAGATYLWSGPGGFQSTAQNPRIVNAPASASGTYAVTISTAGCDFSSTTVATVLDVGAACNDGNACTGPDACQAGACAGAVVDCADNNLCTTDGCNPATGCAHGPVGCSATDACHPAGTCDPATGTCSTPLKDADADGHIDAVCAGDDCNDANFRVWHAPVEVIHLGLTGQSPTTLVWDDQRGAAGPETIYDLVSGQVSNGAAIRYNTAGCLPAGPVVMYVDIRPPPAAGAMYWYLVRGRNSCGVGTYGTSPEDGDIIACYYNPPVAP